MEIGAETLVVADFIFAPALLQLAGADQADAARMPRLHPLLGIDHPFQRHVIGLERVFQLTQMLIGIAQIVIAARKVGLKPHGLIVEDQAFLGPAFLGQNGGQRIPQDGFVRHLVDRCLQGIDGDIGLAQVALHAAQIVVAQRRVGAGGDIQLEHLRRAVGQLHVPGRQAQIDQQFRVFGVQFEGALISHQRLVQMAHPLQRHGQNVERLGIFVIGLGRLQRPLAGLDDVAATPDADGALEQDVGA